MLSLIPELGVIPEETIVNPSTPALTVVRRLYCRHTELCQLSSQLLHLSREAAIFDEEYCSEGSMKTSSGWYLKEFHYRGHCRRRPILEC